MKELLSAFGSEVFRPLMTLLAPGVVALSPWLIGLMQRHDELYSLINQNRTESSLVIVLIALVLGMLLEDFGSRIEVRQFDRALDKLTDGQHSRNWDAYLRLAFRVEPVGVRYLRSVVLRMKFELSLGSAALIVVFGVFATTMDTPSAALLSMTSCGFGAIMFWEARNSHAVLSRTRALLLEGITLLPEASQNDR